MVTKQKTEGGISCMSGCCSFPEIPFSQRVWKCAVCLYKGTLTQEQCNQEHGDN